MMLKMYKYICALTISFCWLLPTEASEFVLTSDTVKNKTLYSSREEARRALSESPKAKFFSGVSVGFDIVGPIMKMASSSGHLEAMCRVNILETYFPTLEIGFGQCSHTDENSDVCYSTKAPYYRIGLDYNFAKNKFSGNRIFGGVRYGFTTFDYDVSSPNLIDPNWGVTIPFQQKDVSGKKQWAELLFGIESRVTSFLQIGWAVRYKFGLSENAGTIGKPWYVPGYGRNKNGIFGANFNIIFEL